MPIVINYNYNDSNAETASEDLVSGFVFLCLQPLSNIEKRNAHLD